MHVFIAIYITLHFVWISAIAAFLLRSAVPIFNQLFTYGKLSSLSSPPRITSTFVRLLFKQIIPTPLAWKLFYITAIISSAVCSVVMGTPSSLPPILYTIQVTRRLFECFRVHNFSKSRLVSMSSLLLGVAYYISATLTIHLESTLSALRKDNISFPQRIAVS